LRQAATLIVGPAWVGDMVIAQALFKFLKSAKPDRELDVLAPAWSLPIVARMPEIRQGIAAGTGHGELALGKRWRRAREIREQGYEHAIVLPRSFKAALIPWLAGIPRRTGFRGEFRFGLINDLRPFERDKLDQTVKRFVALGMEADGELPPIQHPSLSVCVSRRPELLKRLNLDLEKPVIAMMPGAEYGPAKCWPLEYYAELGRQLTSSGYAVWILGSAKDAPAGQLIAEQKGGTNLCGKTSLEDVIDVLGMCEQAVSNDSGLMHVAAAAGIHVHGVYGSSSPAFTPPLTGRRDIHYLGIDCSPCFRRNCPLGHLNCLREIRPQTIFERILAAR
jgi:heptosyltransferase-2